ncbi:fimbrial protein [Hafnia paralvei]|uniref:fimbrial protein n=1 Tax=Hafnia paralvei TaxID=546367 RepID=UPI003CF0F24D
MRGNYVLSTLNVTITCQYNDDGPNTRLIANPSGSFDPSSPFGPDFQGNTAVSLTGGGLGIEVYETPEGRSPVWFGSFLSSPNAGFPASQSFNVEFGVDLVSLNNGSAVTAGAHSFSGQVGYLSVKSAQRIPVIMGAFNLNVIFTSCQLNASEANLSWINLSSADIISGVVPPQEARVGADCGDVPTPVSITFSSSRGYVNAAQGIVKTDSDGSNNLGLQLSWVSTGQPINMNETTHATIKAQQFDVSAKPVAINSGAPVKSGDYNGTVTMMFSYR